MFGWTQTMTRLIPSVLLIGLLAACQSAPAESSSAEQLPAPEQNLIFLKEQLQQEEPTSLDEAQLQLYRSAYDFYRCFYIESGYIEGFDGPGTPITEAPIVREENGLAYQQVTGALNQWSDFQEYAGNILTQTLFDQLNQTHEGAPIYIDVDGGSYFLDCVRVTGNYLTETVSFALAH